MRKCAALIAAALVLGLASFAEAAQLLSPPYFLKTRASGGVGTQAACVIRNAGTTPVTVSVSLVVNQEATPIFDFCHVNGNPLALAAGATCLVSAILSEGEVGLTDNSGGSYVACKVTANNVTNLRGTLELAETPSHGFDVYLAVDF